MQTLSSLLCAQNERGTPATPLFSNDYLLLNFSFFLPSISQTRVINLFFLVKLQYWVILEFY